MLPCVCFPLNRKVSPDEYEAIAGSWRRGWVLTLSTIRPTSLRAFMYYLSTSKDGEYVFQYSDGPIMDADAVLDELPTGA